MLKMELLCFLFDNSESVFNCMPTAQCSFTIAKQKSW